MYGENMTEFKKVRNEADPEGMFLGSWHRKYLLSGEPRFPLEEAEVGREPLPSLGGFRILGAMTVDEGHMERDAGNAQANDEDSIRPSSSQSSFDIMHGGEAEESRVLMS
jgi:D-arabinono-1,4-lactone oxidase